MRIRKRFILVGCAIGIGYGGDVGAQEIRRRLTPLAWEVSNPVPGRMESPLLRPGPVVATESAAYLYDYGDSSLKAVNLQNGELLWSVGRRGGGPGEFSNPTDVRLSADGRLWVLDPPNLRISMFSTDGEFLGSMRVEESLFRLGSIAGSRFLAIRSDPMDGLLVELDSTGRLHREVPSPAWTSDVPAMAAGVWIATDATDGAMAVVFPYSGRTLFAKASDAPFRDVVDVVESRPEPEQLTYSPRPGMTVRRLTPKASMLVVSAAISSDEIWILINDTGEEGNRLVDRYSRATGEYVGSWRLPLHLNKIVAAGSAMIGLQTDEFPAVFLLRPPVQRSH